MTRGNTARSVALRAIGGDHKAIRAEQLRALGKTDRAIARLLRTDVAAVGRWFQLQDQLARDTDVDGVA